MRIAPALSALFATAFATAAFAQPVTVERVSYSPAFQEELNGELGAREGQYLRERITHAITRALAHRGVAAEAGAIDVVIIDADPNRPTFQQLSDTPGLSFLGSRSIGGAELRAVLHDSQGAVLTEVTHKRYDYSIFDYGDGGSTWNGAQRAISQFANKVADAYVAHARAR